MVFHHLVKRAGLRVPLPVLSGLLLERRRHTHEPPGLTGVGDKSRMGLFMRMGKRKNSAQKKTALMPQALCFK
jgi:hypothetical protein